MRQAVVDMDLELRVIHVRDVPEPIRRIPVRVGSVPYIIIPINYVPEPAVRVPVHVVGVTERRNEIMPLPEDIFPYDGYLDLREERPYHAPDEGKRYLLGQRRIKVKVTTI